MAEPMTAFGLEWPRVGPGSALANPDYCDEPELYRPPLGQACDGPPEGDAHYSTDMRRLRVARNLRRYERRYALRNGLSIRTHRWMGDRFPQVVSAERRHRSDLTLVQRTRLGR